MLHKLYALANSQCCDDNADALTHHEIMLPGHLLLKFANEKLADCMAMFKVGAAASGSRRCVQNDEKLTLWYCAMCCQTAGAHGPNFLLKYVKLNDQHARSVLPGMHPVTPTPDVVSKR